MTPPTRPGSSAREPETHMGRQLARAIGHDYERGLLPDWPDPTDLILEPEREAREEGRRERDAELLKHGQINVGTVVGYEAGLEPPELRARFVSEREVAADKTALLNPDRDYWIGVKDGYWRAIEAIDAPQGRDTGEAGRPRLCGCMADMELGMSSVCRICGHRDHGRSGCRALIREVSDAD